MLSKIKQFVCSSYIKSLAVLASGSLLGAIIIAATEIVRTWYIPAEYIGVYSFLIAFPYLFISITSFRYEIAIVVESQERRALALVKLSAYILIFVVLISTTGYLLYIFVQNPSYSVYWYTVPLASAVVLGYGVNNILNAYSNRRKAYHEISEKYVTRTIAQNATALVLGIIAIFVLGIPSLSVAALYVPIGLGLFVGVSKQAGPLFEHWSELCSITRGELLDVARLYKKQALYSAPALFVNNYSYSCITFLIESLFNTSTLAYYSISSRVLGMPIALVCGNVARVFIEEAATEYNSTGCFIHAFRKSFAFLTCLAIPMFAVTYCLAPYACELLLGEGWSVAGLYIRVLAVMFAFRLVGTALSQSLAVCNHQGLELFVNLGLVGASLLSGFLTRISGGDIYFFLRWICLTRSICYIVLITSVYLCSRGWIPSSQEKEQNAA